MYVCVRRGQNEKRGAKLDSSQVFAPLMPPHPRPLTSDSVKNHFIREMKFERAAAEKGDKRKKKIAKIKARS